MHEVLLNFQINIFIILLVKKESWGMQMIAVEMHCKGSKKVPSHCHGQVDFPSGRVTFHSHLPDGQGIKQVVCQLTH